MLWVVFTAASFAFCSRIHFFKHGQKNNFDVICEYFPTFAHVRIRTLVCEKKTLGAKYCTKSYYIPSTNYVALRKSGFLSLSSQFKSKFSIRGYFLTCELFLSNQLRVQILICVFSQHMQSHSDEAHYL